MGQVNINRLTNGNVYVDGVSWFGSFEEVTLPDIKAIMSEHKGLGMIGKLEFVAGIDKLEMKIKWNSVYQPAMKASADFYTPHQLTVRASLEQYDATAGRVAQLPVVVNIRGQFKKLPGLGLKQQDNVEAESELTCTAYQMIINGEEVVDLDLIAQVYRVDGVDLMATYRSNLGI